MTDREIFDKVRAHLLNQGVRAMVNDACRYRTPQGMACAVGCLIPEEFYDPMIETGVLPYCAHGLWNDSETVDENDDVTLVDVMNQCGIPARDSVCVIVDRLAGRFARRQRAVEVATAAPDHGYSLRG
jgi:hypothetical protein